MVDPISIKPTASLPSHNGGLKISLGKCDFCSSPDVVLIAGYRYCAPCSWKLDRVLIHNTLINAFPHLTLHNIELLCTEMFGTKDYRYAEFPRLYKILERGEWKKDHFEIPQDEYLINVTRKFILANHPQLAKRI